MPFRRPPEPPKEAQQPSEERPPLLKLGGLFPSKSGNALTGNVNLWYKTRQGEASVGTKLAELLQQCAKENRPVRVLVFENTGKWGGKGHAPYSLHVCLGNVLQKQDTPTAEFQQPEGYPTYEDAPDEPLEPDTPEPPAIFRTPEPTPRPPVRRVAPRR